MRPAWAAALACPAPYGVGAEAGEGVGVALGVGVGSGVGSGDADAGDRPCDDRVFGSDVASALAELESDGESVVDGSAVVGAGSITRPTDVPGSPAMVEPLIHSKAVRASMPSRTRGR